MAADSASPSIADIDAAIAAKSQPSLADINAAISAKTPNDSGFSFKRAANAAVDMLPAAGATVGGFLGLPEGGIGAIPGAALGGAIGTGARNVIRGFQNQGLDYLTGKPTLSGTLDQTGDVAKGAIDGASQEMGGQLLGAATKSFVGSGIKDVSKQNLSDAASRLGITPTIGMKSADPMTRGMESSLEQSNTIAGHLTRSDTMPVRQSISDATANLLKDASDSSAYETGLNASKGISAQMGEKLNNAQMAYENFNKELPKMVPDFESQAKLADDMANSTKGNVSATIPENYGESIANKIVNSKNLDDIESVRKQVSNSLTNAYNHNNGTGDLNAVDLLSGMQDKLENFRDDQFVKQAQDAYPGPNGTKMGEQMVQEYQQAKAGWADLYNDTKELGPIFGIKNKAPRAFVEAVTKISPEQMSDKLFTPGNFDKLNLIKENFPDQFEQVKNLKLSDIKTASQTVVNGEDVIDPNKFLRQVDKFSPEVQKSLFGDGMQTINDIRTVTKSFPAKMGPSGTPQGTSAIGKFGLGEIPTQAAAAAQRGVLNMRGSPLIQGVANNPITAMAGKQAIGTIMSPNTTPQPQNGGSMPVQTMPQPGPVPAPAQPMQRPLPSATPIASQAQQPAPNAKGMDKWALDGFQNLRSHVGDEDRKVLDAAKDKMLLDPKMKNLLVTASNFEPGSKPLDDIIGHLKKSLAK